ncbi:MAG: hypothetical protein A3B11_00190 [Candidatus Taylorbacteria bacterium RIFCSPLOWO2_01_FULL_44_26]|uniref:Addiction module toxin, HicA family n=2 Tax=Candidatus Tayloriibacteriota TaxID=1817919 RepID=A0A1G2ML21_9BACT|nr:MAG: hypothetical protein A3D50_01830 [Candidatus Taylorbacteria bacterium RIFCSPHIGHO2_02_FULL_44_12]OHA31109.1 MAG: hypothetical protein A3B11_00190 [Candidatus Taylorbacteria bacterium RIFCSPLOWO2_01_FULL_44_26]
MRIKLTNFTPDDVLAMFMRLGGFKISQGSKHIKVTHTTSGKATTIPRHSRVDPYILRSIINHFIVKELGYKIDDVYSSLKKQTKSLTR